MNLPLVNSSKLKSAFLKMIPIRSIPCIRRNVVRNSLKCSSLTWFRGKKRRELWSQRLAIPAMQVNKNFFLDVVLPEDIWTRKICWGQSLLKQFSQKYLLLLLSLFSFTNVSFSYICDRSYLVPTTAIVPKFQFVIRLFPNTELLLNAAI